MIRGWYSSEASRQKSWSVPSVTGDTWVRVLRGDITCQTLRESCETALPSPNRHKTNTSKTDPIPNCCCTEPTTTKTVVAVLKSPAVPLLLYPSCRDARTSRMLEMVTTEALKKAKKAGMAKMPSHKLPKVKTITISISRELVTPAAMSSFECFFVSISWPAATPLNAGMSP